MFCDSCGAAVQPAQTFCNRCGKQFIGRVAVLQQPTCRVQAHTHLLGILWLAISAMNAVAGIVLCVLGSSVLVHLREMGAPAEFPAGFLSSLFGIVGIAILVKSAFGFVAGWGLLRYQSWARVLTLVLAFIALFHVPFGTALGVYTLWVLLPAQSQQEYDTLVSRAD
jgi:ABC-type glycerol-3-phosphate transport system permease component